MSSMQPIFSKSLETLAQPREKSVLEAANSRKTRQLLNLAQFVTSAFVDKKEILTTLDEQGCYRLTTSKTPEPTLKKIATILAQLSNHPATYVGSDGQVHLCEPIGIPIIINNAPSQIGARLGLANKLFEALSSRKNLPAAAPELQLSDRHSQKLTRFSGHSIQYRSSGVPELIVNRDFTVLGDNDFLTVLKDLRLTHGLFILRCQPTFESTCSAARELIGTTAAWELRQEASGLTLAVMMRPETPAISLAGIVSRLEIRADQAIKATPVKSDNLIVIAPSTHAADSPTSLSNAAYLKYSLSAPRLNSNIVACSFPCANQNPNILQFAASHISSGSNFVVVKANKPTKCMSAEEFRKASRELTQKLALPATTITENRTGDLFVHPPSLTEVPRVESLLLHASYLQFLTTLCTNPVTIIRDLSQVEMFAFFARFIGHTTDWSFEIRGTHVAVRTRAPERFTPEVRGHFLTLFGKEIKVFRDPEPEHGEFLIDPREAEAQISNKQYSASGLEEIFPRAFGNPPVVQQHGNRVLVYTMTKNLPSAYRSAVAAELYGFGVPVVIREDAKAQLVTDGKILQDIALRSLPAGVYLRKIIETADTFEVELVSRAKDRARARSFLKELKACSAKKVKITWRSPSPELSALWELCGGSENDRRFLTLSIGDDNAVADSETLRSAFFDLFSLSPARSDDLQDPSFIIANREEDLTHLECFSIDKDGSYLSEDAFSIEQLGDGGYRIGIHVIAASRLIPFGSIPHVIARRIGRSFEADIDGKSQLVQLFPNKIRARFRLADEPRFAFSLTFETNQDLTIHPESYHLRLALVRNNNHLHFSTVDATLQHASASSDRLVSSLKVLERFAHKCSSHGAHFPDRTARMPATDITQLMLEIFNWHADSQLREAGIALPLKDSHVIERFQTKFSGPARSYRVLLAQHQLERYLLGKQPLNGSLIDEQLALTGYPASESFAYYLIQSSRNLRGGDPYAEVVIQSDGNLALRYTEKPQTD